MVIADTAVYELGRFTIVQRPRPDNPAWAVYLVFLKDRLVGKSFSRPDQSCCEWLHRQKNEEIRYADPAQSHTYSFKLRGVAKARRGGAGYDHETSELSKRASLAVGTGT